MVIWTVKPSAVAVGVPNAGIGVGPPVSGIDVAVTSADPPMYPALKFMIVAVELVPGATPVTVTKPEPVTTTEPDAVAVPPHM